MNSKDLDILWDICLTDIPDLFDYCVEIIKNYTSPEQSIITEPEDIRNYE